MSSPPHTSDVWDIAQFVEGHPDDHDQRWRLAKKLHMAGEHRLALEHLQVLKNEWEDHVNVWRYLAATYYRLQRYPEAIRELETAIEQWPEAVGLREQYAKALERGGDPAAAADAWSVVAEKNPDHPFAGKAARKLRKREQASADKKESERFAAAGMNVQHPTGAPVDSGNTPQIVCPNCHSKNGPDFERCWSCLSPLQKTPQGNATAADTGRSPSTEGAATIAVGVFIVGLLSVCVYQSLSALASVTELDSALYSSARDAVLAHSVQARIIVGLILLVAWPVALRVAMLVVNATETSPNRLHAAGIALAALSFATVPWPSNHLILLLGIPALASLATIVLVFGLNRTDALIAWSVQGVVVTLVVLTAAAALHGPRVLLESGAIGEASAELTEPLTLELSGTVPYETRFTLATTGSSWLDGLIGQAEIEVSVEPLEDRAFVEVLKAGRTIEFTRIDMLDFKIALDELEIAVPYTIRVTSEDKNPVSATILVRSLLDPGV